MECLQHVCKVPAVVFCNRRGATSESCGSAIFFLTTLISQRLTIDPLWRLFFVIGFLGAYTTFSTCTYETATLIREGAYVSALVCLLGSVPAGIFGVFAGTVLAERL